MDDLSKAQKAVQKDGLGSRGKGREPASETSAPLARMTSCISCGCGIQTHGSNGLTIETQATAQTFSADFSVAIAAGARSLQKKTRHCTSPTHRHHLDSAAKLGRWRNPAVQAPGAWLWHRDEEAPRRPACRDLSGSRLREHTVTISATGLPGSAS